MKKFLFSVFAGVLALTVLTACGEINEEHLPDEEQLEKAGAGQGD